MTNQETDTQQKTTLQLARAYVAKLHEISGAMAEPIEIKLPPTRPFVIPWGMRELFNRMERLKRSLSKT